MIAAVSNINVAQETRDRFEKILEYTGQLARLPGSNESEEMSINECEYVKISGGMVDAILYSGSYISESNWSLGSHENEAPLKGMDHDGKKYLKSFSVKVPVLTMMVCSLQMDSEGKPVFKTGV